jgi:nucleoside-diphosphate-sugar epimerase
VRQLIHLSSVAAMGRSEGTMLTERDRGEPRSPYARTKRAAEEVLEAAGVSLPVTILRPTSVFGPGRGLAATLCRVAVLPIIPLPDGGRALVPFCYVDNVAAAVAAAVDNERCLGRTFIVGDERSYPLRAIVLGLARAIRGRPARTVPVPAVLVRGIGAIEGRLARLRGRLPLLDESRLATLTRSVSYSTVAFREATGFSPPVPFDEALRRLAAAYVEARR